MRCLLGILGLLAACATTGAPQIETSAAPRETLATCRAPRDKYVECLMGCARKADNPAKPAVIEACATEYPYDLDAESQCIHERAPALPGEIEAVHACAEQDGCNALRAQRPSCFGPDSKNLPQS
jgi:hypothetical protein